MYSRYNVLYLFSMPKLITLLGFLRRRLKNYKIGHSFERFFEGNFTRLQNCSVKWGAYCHHRHLSKILLIGLHNFPHLLKNGASVPTTTKKRKGGQFFTVSLVYRWYIFGGHLVN